MNFNYVEGVGRMASRGRGGRGGEGIRTVECGNLLTSTEERGRSQNTTPIGGLKTHSGMRNAESVMASAQPISFSGFFFFVVVGDLLRALELSLNAAVAGK